MPGPTPGWSGAYVGAVSHVVNALRVNGPMTLPELARHMEVWGLANLHGDAIRAGGYDVLVGWVLDDLGPKDKPGLIPDSEGRYSLPDDGEYWWTSRGLTPSGRPTSSGRATRRLYEEKPLDTDPYVELPPALEQNPFDPSWGRWRDNLPARTITDDDIADMSTSIRQRGWDADTGRILVDEHGSIIDGRLRAAALDAMGIDWRHDGRYVAAKHYGDAPADNARRILDALTRNGRAVTAKTRAAMAEQLAAEGSSIADITAALGVGKSVAYVMAGETKAERDAAKRGYARRLVLDKGYSLRSAADEIGRFYGGPVPGVASIKRWVENGDSAEVFHFSGERKNGTPEPKPKPERPPTVRDKVLELATQAGATGVTTDDVRAALGMMAHQTVSARLHELVRDGLLIDTGERRPSASGKSSRVLAVPPTPSPPTTPKAAKPIQPAHCRTCTCFQHD